MLNAVKSVLGDIASISLSSEQGLLRHWSAASPSLPPPLLFPLSQLRFLQEEHRKEGVTKLESLKTVIKSVCGQCLGNA